VHNAIKNSRLFLDFPYQMTIFLSYHCLLDIIVPCFIYEEI